MGFPPWGNPSREPYVPQVRLRRALPHQLVEVTAAAGRGKVRIEGNDRWTILMVRRLVGVEPGGTGILHGLCWRDYPACLVVNHDGPPFWFMGRVGYHGPTDERVSALQHYRPLKRPSDGQLGHFDPLAASGEQRLRTPASTSRSIPSSPRSNRSRQPFGSVRISSSRARSPGA